MATVIIPTPLRKFTNNQSKLSIQAGTVEQTVQQLTDNFPDLKKHLLDEKGQLRTFINVFVGNDDIRDLQQQRTEVKEDSVISIVPAIAGGAGGGCQPSTISLGPKCKSLQFFQKHCN